MSVALIILAAGQGTRMRSEVPKVLHKVAGAELLVHAMRSGAALTPDRTIVVTGHGGDAVADVARLENPDARVARQIEQNGTAHAVAQAKAELTGFSGDAVVLYGDTPLIAPETLARMSAARDAGADLVVLGFEAADPGRYGRLIVEDTELVEIVEYKDATAIQRAVTLCNSGVVMADATALQHWISRVGNDNASGEFYLTDIVTIARAEGRTAIVVTCEEAETLGVNSRSDLAAAEAAFQKRARAALLNSGVTMTAPETVFLSYDTCIEPDAVVEPNVVFGPGVRISRGATIRSFSHIEGAQVAAGAIIGPYARLRPGADVGTNARVGNFVEVKNATLAEGVKVNHLSYVGDAKVGARSNLGAGTVTCNYDGVMKHFTEIGEDAFIGSDTMLIAPVQVGDRAMTGSGSVITRNVPDEALALARARQDNRPGLAPRLMEQLRATKARRAMKKHLRDKARQNEDLE